MKIAQTSSTLGIVRSRSRSQGDFEIFLHLPQYKLSSPISQLWDMYVCSSDNNIQDLLIKLRKLKFSSNVYLPSSNKMFQYSYASLILCNEGQVRIFDNGCYILGLEYIRMLILAGIFF